ncbi:MAG: polysaccharide biosynthesis/export family protein [Candidatus Omnitrophota bacterium]|nr:polysaccharide biosynthesis/export family protein [Candidatus Omnitrophota bacterium]
MKRTLFILTVLICCVVLAQPSFAQASKESLEKLGAAVADLDGSFNMEVPSGSDRREGVRPSRQLSVVTYLDYSIQPNTVLHISLKGDEMHLEDPGKTLRVSAKGTIVYPYVGEVEVINMTEAEVAEKLEKLLEKDYVRAPEVSVTIIASPGYWMLGDVNAPGRYNMIMDRETTLNEAIAIAGGFREASGITLFRNDWTSIRVVRTELGVRNEYMFKLNDIPQTFTVKPDDIILCRYGEMMDLGNYYIFGEVKNPGKYPIVSDDFSGRKLFKYTSTLDKYITILGASNVVDAVLVADDLTDNAARNWVYLVRKENGRIKRRRIPIGHIYYKGNLKTNLKLKDGDVITVSESWF